MNIMFALIGFISAFLSGSVIKKVGLRSIILLGCGSLIIILGCLIIGNVL